MRLASAGFIGCAECDQASGRRQVTALPLPSVFTALAAETRPLSCVSTACFPACSLPSLGKTLPFLVVRQVDLCGSGKKQTLTDPKYWSVNRCAPHSATKEMTRLWMRQG